MNACPLCHSEHTTVYTADRKRTFLCCSQCALVFADPTSWPDASQEKAEYDQHENHPEDAGYQRFLARMSRALHRRLPPAADILDFGCGPSPVLAMQLQAFGHHVDLYDVFYYPEREVLTQRYDAIVMTEVIEHLHTPGRTLAELFQQLKPGGVLAIMTQRVIGRERFEQRNYKNDPTHVCFYSDATFHWIANERQAKLSFEERDLVFLTRP